MNTLESALETIVRPVLESIITGGRVPGLVVALARGDAPSQRLALGVDGVGQPLAEDSLFPIASVTKLATALAVLRLVDTGALALDDPLADHLPDAAAAQPGVTVRTLLCHISGLPPEPPEGSVPYAPGLDWPTIARACLRTPPDHPLRSRVQYGNVGYGLLALIVEQQTGRPFPAALEALVLAPLGIEGYLGTEPPRPPATLADVRSSHTGSALEPFNSAFWRSLALPWAGLVTTAAGALGLVRAFRGIPSGFLSPGLLAEATSNQTGDLSGGFVAPLIWPHCWWGLGPELRDSKELHWAPPEAGPNSFGHSGASGCVAWADPDADVAWAIHGGRTADNGWLLRRGPAIGAAILKAAREA